MIMVKKATISIHHVEFSTFKTFNKIVEINHTINGIQTPFS